MGRRSKKSEKFFWKSRSMIFRKSDYLRKLSSEKKVRTFSENLNPSFLSTIEYHYLTNSKLKIKITGKEFTGNLPEIQELFKELCTSLRENIEIEFYLQQLPLIYLSPILLAKAIAGSKNFNGLFQDNIFFNSISGKSSYFPTTNLIAKNNLKISEVIGIRIEIKGLTGKMSMSKKIIKTFGTFKFNSSFSVIDFGFAHLKSSRGILGVKVWISYPSYPALRKKSPQ